MQALIWVEALLGNVGSGVWLLRWFANVEFKQLLLFDIMFITRADSN